MRKILLADDSVTIQKVVRLTLEEGEFELLTVDNGEDALRLAREARPELVLADAVMPGLDGYQLCAALKSDPALGPTRVVLLGGSFEAYDPERGRAVGADGFISKPFESKTLLAAVHQALGITRPLPPEPPPAITPQGWFKSLFGGKKK